MNALSDEQTRLFRCVVNTQGARRVKLCVVDGANPDTVFHPRTIFASCKMLQMGLNSVIEQGIHQID